MPLLSIAAYKERAEACERLAAMDIDYRDLLRRFILFAEVNAGRSVVGDWWTRRIRADLFTDEEREALEHLDAENG
jgi:hypothetical protein